MNMIGNKLNHVAVVYTPWSNLRKTADMAVGQIGFHSQKEVKRFTVEKRENAVINELNRTKVCFSWTSCGSTAEG